MSNTIKYPLVLLCVCVAAGIALAASFSLTYGTIRSKEQEKERRAIVSAFWNVETPQGATWNQYDEKTAGNDTVYVGYRDAAKSEILGYAALGEAEGYSSTIRMMVGAQPLGDGRYRILGVKIISQQETPGLGARVNDVFTSDTLWSVLDSALSGMKVQPEPTAELADAAEALGVPATAFPARPGFQKQFANKIVTVINGRARGIELSSTGWEKVAAGGGTDGGSTGASSTSNEISAMTGATVSSRAALQAAYNAVEKIDRAVGRLQHTPVETER